MTFEACAGTASASMAAMARSAGRSLFTEGIRTRLDVLGCGSTRNGEDLALLVPVRNTTPVEVVGRQLDLHPVARQDADVVAAHLAGDVAEHLVPVVELHSEHRVGERLGDLPLHLDLVFLRQSRRNLPAAQATPGVSAQLAGDLGELPGRRL